MPPKTAVLVTASVGDAGSSGSGTSSATPPKTARPVASIRHVAGTFTSMPPNIVPRLRRASGASVASRRSSEIPPNHVTADPPPDADARLWSSMPFVTATSASSSLSASPREGSARLRSKADAIEPTQNPSLKRRRARKTRTASGYPRVSTMAHDGGGGDPDAARGGVSCRRSHRGRGPHGGRRPLPGHGGECGLRRALSHRPASTSQRGASGSVRRRLDPRTAHQDERNRMKPLNEQISEVISEEPVALFMKGTPQMVMCGNSMRALQALHAAGAPITTVDILPDPQIRQELSAISGWPTIPQVFVNGELLGGADITEELSESGELQRKLDDALGADRSKDVKVVALELS